MTPMTPPPPTTPLSSLRLQLAVLLVALAVYNGALLWLTEASDSRHLLSGVAWGVGMSGIPIGLVGALLAGHRWPFMAAVIYATTGLALDLATLVHGLTHNTAWIDILVRTGPTSGLNFGAILLGGMGLFQIVRGSALPGTSLPNDQPRLSP